MKKRHDYDDDLFDEFEGWEEEYDYLNNKQYDKLVQLREKNVKRDPDDIHAILDLCDAYCLNKEYLKALENLEKIYKDNSEINEIQYLILETLWNLGKDEKEFEWDKAPVIFYLDEVVCNLCYDILKGKRKAVEICDLYMKLYDFGYTKFVEKELLELLSKDSRFLIEYDEHPMFSSVKRKPLR